MTRLSSLLAVLLLVIASAPKAQTGSESDVDCARACALPDTAPPECSCVVIGVNASSDVANPDPVAKAVADAVRDTYARAAAPIDNYTVVYVTSAGGPPAVSYYEKVIIDEYPAFRLIGPAELGNREAEARGDLTGNEVAGGIAAALGRLGADRDMPESEEAASADSGERDPLAEGLSALLGKAQEAFERISRHNDSVTRDELAVDLLSSKKFFENARVAAFDEDIHAGLVTHDIARAMSSAVLYVDEDRMSDISMTDLLGYQNDNFEIVSAAALIDFEDLIIHDEADLIEAASQLDGDALVFYMTVNIRDKRSGQNFTVNKSILDNPDLREFISQENGVPMVIHPRETKLNISNASLLFGQMIAEQLNEAGDWEVVTRALKGIVNEGPPTQDRIRQLIGEAMAQGEMGDRFNQD